MENYFISVLTSAKLGSNWMYDLVLMHDIALSEAKLLVSNW